MRTILVARAYIVDGHKVLVDARKSGRRLFGGKVEKGETIKQALRRELLEEIGIECILGQVVAVNEKLKKKTRTIELVLMARMIVDGTDLKALERRGRHNPKWVDIAESGMRFGVTLE